MSESETRSSASEPTASLPKLLETIAGQARRTNQVRIAQLRTALEQAAEHGLDRAGWGSAERTAHQLAGSAGTFGFAKVSQRARQLEQFFARAVEDPPDQERLAAATVLLEEAGTQLDDGSPSD